MGASYTAPRETIAAQVHAFLATLYRDGIILREDPRAAVLGAAAARAGLGAAQASHETGLGAVGSSRETGLGTTGASDESMLGTAAAARETPVAPVVSQPGVSEQFTGLPLERFGNLRPLVGGPVDDRLPFDSMTVNRFEDLDQLLSIDPVHEVKDAGWPHRQAAD